MSESVTTLVNTSGSIRLDRLLCDHFRSDAVSRETVKGWIRQGLVSIGGNAARKPGQAVPPGAEVVVHVPETQPPSSLSPVRGKVDVVHEDAHLLIVNKSPDVTVHPAPGLEEPTLIEHLLHRFPDLGDMEGVRPGIVHRIDKGTSGLLVVARTPEAAMRLTRAFAGREVRKRYLAIVKGVPDPASGTVNAPMGRHPSIKTRMAVVGKGGKEALSDYATLLACPEGRWSLQEVRIHTGRTHQIRVHMAHLGHPLLGDTAYGGPSSLDTHPALAARPMLHAFDLAFAHPETSAPMHFTQPPPKDFPALLLALHRRCQRVVVTGLLGSGKSTLARVLETLGLPLFSADRVVRDLYQPEQDGWVYLHHRFGGRFTGQGPVDKRALFQAILENPPLRQEIEQAIHPMVFHRLETFWREQARARAAVAEIPLYFEAGATLPTVPDLVVGVHCPADIRRERAMARGLAPEAIDTLDSWQWPEAAKLNRCQLIVDNSRDLAHLHEQGRALFRILRDLRRDSARRFLDRIMKLFTPDGTGV